MKYLRGIVALTFVLALEACATQYGTENLTGGYDEEQLSPDTWHVKFAGNGYTTRETVQTFWLYRAAELTLQHGYSSFSIISEIRLVSYTPEPGSDGARLLYASDETTFIPKGSQVSKPFLSGDIRMFKQRYSDPPRMFDAAALKAALEPLVKGSLCGGNVCAHIHSYLRPPLKV